MSKQTLDQMLRELSRNIPQIETKKHKKTWLKITGIVTAAFFSLFLYKSVIMPNYEISQKRRQIEVAEQQFEDYESELIAILSDNIVDDEENERLPVLSNELGTLSERYKQLGVQRDVHSLQDYVAKSKKIYQDEVERRKQIASLDKELESYQQQYSDILTGGVSKKERAELDRISSSVKTLREKYVSLNADENVIRTDRLESEVNLAAERFDLDERYQHTNERYQHIAQDGFSLSEEGPLMDILNSVEDLRVSYIQMGLETVLLDTLIENVNKAISTIKTAKKITSLNTLFRDCQLEYGGIEVTGKDESEKSSLENLKERLYDLTRNYRALGLKQEVDEAYTLIKSIHSSIKEYERREHKITELENQLTQYIDLYNDAFSEGDPVNIAHKLKVAARLFRVLVKKYDAWNSKYGLNLDTREVLEWREKTKKVSEDAELSMTEYLKGK